MGDLYFTTMGDWFRRPRHVWPYVILRTGARRLHRRRERGNPSRPPGSSRKERWEPTTKQCIATRRPTTAGVTGRQSRVLVGMHTKRVAFCERVENVSTNSQKVFV